MAKGQASKACTISKSRAFLRTRKQFFNIFKMEVAGSNIGSSSATLQPSAKVKILYCISRRANSSTIDRAYLPQPDFTFIVWAMANTFMCFVALVHIVHGVERRDGRYLFHNLRPP